MDSYKLVNIEGMKTIDTTFGPLEVDGFLKQIEAAEKIIESYYSFNDKTLPVQRGIARRTFRYKDESCDTENELLNLKNFITDYKDKEPNQKYDVKVSYIDEYDDYGKLENPTWGEKFTNLFNVFDTLIKPSLTADNVQVVEKTVQVQGLDANTFWTAKGAKATIAGVVVAAITSIVGAFLTFYGIQVQHKDAVLDQHNQVIQQAVPQSQPITPENSTVVVPTETL